ncbi:uncharacterized protein A4U43_C04F1070 [Asparagus officinalis]|uniref:Uncharacterized protein n=1 Tax=Asparagus officinalis TaxID=4686 RepID=A0A5P1EZ47_ASPOF|nr:uncharacterized protein A4U43_C04F1070 [Asparagus officinalis]
MDDAQSSLTIVLKLLQYKTLEERNFSNLNEAQGYNDSGGSYKLTDKCTHNSNGWQHLQKNRRTLVHSTIDTPENIAPEVLLKKGEDSYSVPVNEAVVLCCWKWREVVVFLLEMEATGGGVAATGEGGFNL